MVSSPSPTADTAAYACVAPRSSQATASHMKIGNSTSRNRGSDMSGCGSTG